MWGGWGAFDWRVPVLLLVGVGEATSCRHSNVTVVSDRNTPVRIGHAQLLSGSSELSVGDRVLVGGCG